MEFFFRLVWWGSLFRYAQHENVVMERSPICLSSPHLGRVSMISLGLILKRNKYGQNWPPSLWGSSNKYFFYETDEIVQNAQEQLHLQFVDDRGHQQIRKWKEIGKSVTQVTYSVRFSKLNIQCIFKYLHWKNYIPRWIYALKEEDPIRYNTQCQNHLNL